MGFSISWIAAKGVAKDDLLVRLDLSDTGRPDPENEAWFSFAELPSGWLLIYSSRFDFASPKRIAAASVGGLAVGCAIEEHVMVSEVRFCKDGEALWRAFHEPKNNVYDLILEGDLPAEAEAVKTRLVQRQDEKGGTRAGVDYIFDIPVEIAAAVCGFRHDEPPADGELVFTELEQTLPPREPGKGLLQRIGALFGRA